MIPQPIPAGETPRETGLAPPQPAGRRWQHVFRLARLYWFSRDWKSAWAMLALLVAIQFAAAYGFFYYNRWQRDFFDSISQRQADRLGSLLLSLILILSFQVVILMLNSYLGMRVGISWRSALTTRYLDRWLHRDRFAEIERLRLIDNPDQRIADDINLVTGTTGLLPLALGAISAIVSAIGFALILLETAEPIRLALAGRSITILGSTIWYAVLYSLAGSLLVARIGRPFVRATMRQQHREADFRSGLIHVRRHAPQISFIGLGAVVAEAAALREAFGQIRVNYRSVINASLWIAFAQFVYERLRTVLPLFLLVPRYFAGRISFGQVMAGRDAFEQLASQLSYFVQTYASFGTQIACVNRLKALDDAIDAHQPRGISFTASPGDEAAIATRGLRLHRPDGAALVEIGDWTVQHGERWMICGASGIGKSTLLRAVAGLWPDGHGTVAMTDRGLAMLVPQRLYLPLGTLKAAVCFPDLAETHDDHMIVALLKRVGLAAHAGHLHALRMWQDELSPGEQQRIALARILLHRPTLLVLDEATSALDDANAHLFHQAILDAAPGVTLVSVLHDDSLAVFHTHALTIGPGGVQQRRLDGQA